MGPTRKSRSLNKRSSYIDEVSPVINGENADKRSKRKRKLSDMLGPQWSKEELECFYEAYRKHGKDWKKVGAVVRNRSIEMVEALYSMNRAYLSLPEGTASVAGLIAMMTDHYCNLAGSDSDQESNDGAGTSRKPQKRGQGKSQPKTSKAFDGSLPSHSLAVSSSYDCLPTLKKKRSGGARPRVVGKRTPRFPVSYSYENVNGERYFSPTRQGLKSKVDDYELAQIAKTLTEVSQSRGSPQISLTPKKLVGGIDMDEDGLEGSMEADNGDFSRDKSYLMKIKHLGSLPQKARRPYRNKVEDSSGNNYLDEIREACSGTEEGQTSNAVQGKSDIEVSDANISRSSQGLRKRSKKVLFQRDESFDFEALQTLADLSLMPESATDNEPSLQIKEENNEIHKSESLEAMPANHQREKRQLSGIKVKGSNPISVPELATDRTSKPGKTSAHNVNPAPEEKLETRQSISKLSRKKQKTSYKVLKSDADVNSHMSESQEVEATDMVKKTMSKGKRSSQFASPKLVKHSENSSSSTDLRKEGDDSALSTVHAPVADHADLYTKNRNRRKMKLHRPQKYADLKASDRTIKDQPSALFPSLHVTAPNLKMQEKLSNCFSNHLVRRWCAFEWFYSAIDYPWFAKREFVEYLYHVGLGHVPRLTRVEWGVIRSSLGKPRRFSDQFLKEEKEKLNQYRESVRKHYNELRSGTREGLPTDLARPLSVGQRVIAIHPKTREINDGSVLTVDHDRCRVQFDRPELGVEFVMDIDCMPSNPLENMPTLLARHTIAVDKFLDNITELKMNGHMKDQRVEGYLKFSPSENLANINGHSDMLSSTYPVCNLLKQTKVASTNMDSEAKIAPREDLNNMQSAYSQPFAQTEAKEADVQALAELTRALEKKNALVSELGQLNNDVLENQKDGVSALKDLEPFKKQYAAVVVQLQEANERVSSALYCLRLRNTYQGNFSFPWPRSMTNISDSGGLFSSTNCSEMQTEESRSHVCEIIESSRMRACTMVNSAIKAYSSMKGEENTFEKIEEAIDYVNDQLSLDDLYIPSGRSSEDADHGNLSPQEQFKPSTLNSLHALSSPKSKNPSSVPSELITKCVATLLMIQNCTERLFPPADVAQILDSAVTSLQPCCSENLPVYADIEKCMIMIRNQIMALIPT